MYARCAKKVKARRHVSLLDVTLDNPTPIEMIGEIELYKPLYVAQEIWRITSAQTLATVFIVHAGVQQLFED